jgi:hypothetical protein
MRRRRVVAPVLILVAVVAGCQPAERYGPRPVAQTPTPKAVDSEKPKVAENKPLDPEIQWIDIDNPPKPEEVIDFVHAETKPQEWSKLPKFWNPVGTKNGSDTKASMHRR